MKVTTWWLFLFTATKAHGVGDPAGLPLVADAKHGELLRVTWSWPRRA